VRCGGRGRVSVRHTPGIARFRSPGIPRDRGLFWLDGYIPFPIKSTIFRPVLFADNRERNDRSGCYSVLEAPKGSVDCVHQFRRSREHRASGHPSAAATRPYGTAAVRRPAATDPDTPARSAANNRRPAAAPQRLGDYWRRLVPLTPRPAGCRVAAFARPAAHTPSAAARARRPARLDLARSNTPATYPVPIR